MTKNLGLTISRGFMAEDLFILRILTRIIWQLLPKEKEKGYML